MYLPDNPEREAGFTLIELLVVILIIGILAAIAIPMFLNQRKEAVESSMKSDLRNAAQKVGSTMTNSGYPAALPADIKTSEGVTLGYSSGGGSYCIQAKAEGTDKIWYYDSALNGLTQESCSLGINPTGTFYRAHPGTEVIFPDAGTWTQEGTGPSNAPVMSLQQTAGSNKGWGLYGKYEMDGGVIPAGTDITVSYLVKASTKGTYHFQVVNNPMTSNVYEGTQYHVDTAWKRVTVNFVTEKDWIPGVHSLRWGLATTLGLYVSDVEIIVND